MKLSTFCVLLASGLMLMSSLIAGFIKADMKQTEEVVVSSVAEIPETEEFLLAVNGWATQYFGAEYSEALGQWTKNEEMIVAAEEGEIAACSDLYVTAIEQGAEGVCLRLTAGEAEIKVWPVSKVRVFAGSRLKEGDVIADAGEQLFISARISGCAENPERYLKLNGG